MKKRWKRILLSILLLTLSVLLAIYVYASFHELKINDAKKSITIYDTNGNTLYQSNFKKNMEWTSIDDIPEFVQDAFIAVEDKRFYYHAGFDPIRIAKALGSNLSHGGIVEGGSTITQQYAKNLFLTNEQTINRKIDEFFYAARLEMQYSKQEILEGYLNTLYFGHGVYGIKSAAKYLFDLPLENLSTAQIAMLIGIPNGPGIYSPYLHEDNALRRQKLILSILHQNDVINDTEYEQAKQETLVYVDHENVKEDQSIDEFYIDAVLQELTSNTDLNTDQELHVYTNYDPNKQAALMNAVRENMSDEDELECAGILIEPFTSHVVAITGGKDYTQSQYNRAIYAQRQVASTIKPLLYYTALQQGFTPSTRFISQPTSFQVQNDSYEPQNYGNKYPYREISMINAIAMSDNIYAVKTHLFLGTSTLHHALLDFDIEQSQENPSEALGTVNMSVLELSKIYNTFASEGLYQKPSFIRKIVNGQKETVYEHEDENKRLLDRDTTLILNQAMTATYDLKNRTTSYPTMAGFAPLSPFAIKSGTSDWDAWVAGFNPQLTIVLWTGFDDNRNLDKNYYETSKRMFQSICDTLYPDKDGPWYAPSDKMEVRNVEPISGMVSSYGSPYWYMKDDSEQ